MKIITSIDACRRLPLACVLIGTLVLASCGGGGSSAAVATPNNIIASFLDIVPGIDFPWSTSQQSNVGISLSRADGKPLGDLSVLVSKYICDDPTGGGGQLPHPIHLDNYLLYSLAVGEQTETTATLNLGQLQLQIPTATNHVLVEILDNNDSSHELYSKLVAPADLAGLQIVIPLPRLRDTNGEPLSSSPSPLASCN